MSDEPKVAVWLVLEQEGALLVTRRKPDVRPFGGDWGLPGDVMQEEESAAETMARVGLEMLDIRVTEETFVETVHLKDGARDYAINVFAIGFAGHPRYRESGPFAEVSWSLPADLEALHGFPVALAEMLIHREQAGETPA